MDPAGTKQQPAYGEILRLDELLDIACVHDEVDRTLFFAVHQACEIWFAIVLRHLESVCDALVQTNGAAAAERLERLPHIVRVITQHFEVLGTLAPRSFDEIRATLGNSSGFQSVQYREIEFLCGARDLRFLNIAGFTESDRARLLDRLERKSLSSAFLEYRDHVRFGADLLRTGSSMIERIYDALVAFDNAVRSWRARHAELAELFLGNAQGTAGSSGAAYLWRSTERTLFPEIFSQKEGERSNG